MTLPPLAERELRSGARRPVFYWLRGLLALALGFQAYELLSRSALAPRGPLAVMSAPPPAPTITGAMLLHDMTWMLFLVVLLMGLLSADSISRGKTTPFSPMVTSASRTVHAVSPPWRASSGSRPIE